MKRGREPGGGKKLPDGRWLIVLVVLGYVLLVLGAASHYGTARPLLQGLGVPALEYPLMDLRGVASWCDAWLQGEDPAMVETRIPLPGGVGSHPNFLMNYSPLVLGLGKLGLSEKSVAVWGIGLALLYLAALGILCGTCSFRRALLWSLLVCSPASVLVVERGNLDELVFALLVVALLLRKPATGEFKYPMAESAVILVASVIKFFPVVSLLAPWREQNGKGRLAVIFALGLFGIFLLLLHFRLAAIGGSLGGQYQSAFGYSLIADLLRHGGVLLDGGSERMRWMLRLCAFLGMLGSFAAGAFFRAPFAAHPVSARARHAFFLAAPIMLGLFLQGPQMDYKWIFFLPMVPAVLEVASSAFAAEALGAKIWLCAMTTYSYWTFFSDEGSLRNALLKQLLMWGVMFLSAFLAGRIWNHSTSVATTAE